MSRFIDAATYIQRGLLALLVLAMVFDYWVFEWDRTVARWIFWPWVVSFIASLIIFGIEQWQTREINQATGRVDVGQSIGLLLVLLGVFGFLGWLMIHLVFLSDWVFK